MSEKSQDQKPAPAPAPGAIIIQREEHTRIIVEPSEYRGKIWVNIRLEKKYEDAPGFKIIKGLNFLPSEFRDLLNKGKEILEGVAGKITEGVL